MTDNQPSLQEGLRWLERFLQPDPRFAITASDIESLRYLWNTCPAMVGEMTRYAAVHQSITEVNPSVVVTATGLSSLNGDARVFATTYFHRVVRSGPQMLACAHFMRDVLGYTCWSRSVRRTLAEWYTTRPPEFVLSQVRSCPSFGGITHAWLMSRVHPKPRNQVQEALFKTAIEVTLGKEWLR